MSVFENIPSSPRPRLMRILWPFLRTYIGIDVGPSHKAIVKGKMWRGKVWIFESRETSTDKGKHPTFIEWL